MPACLPACLSACLPVCLHPHRALWGPGSNPAHSNPMQLGINNMEWPGLHEPGQQDDAAAAGSSSSSSGGASVSIASESQYLSLARSNDQPLQAGQYVLLLRADMGQPLVTMEVCV
jgi:hypothetical protein